MFCIQAVLSSHSTCIARTILGKGLLNERVNIWRVSLRRRNTEARGSLPLISSSQMQATSSISETCSWKRPSISPKTLVLTLYSKTPDRIRPTGFLGVALKKGMEGTPGWLHWWSVPLVISAQVMRSGPALGLASGSTLALLRGDGLRFIPSAFAPPPTCLHGFSLSLKK